MLLNGITAKGLHAGKRVKLFRSVDVQKNIGGEQRTCRFERNYDGRVFMEELLHPSSATFKKSAEYRKIG